MSALYPPIIIGGAEKSAAELSEASVALGDTVAVVTLHPGGEEHQSSLNGVTLYHVPIDNIYWPYDPEKNYGIVDRLNWHFRDVRNGTAARRFARILDRVRPDIVHTNILVGFSVSIWAEVRKRGIPLVHTLHDFALICRRSTLFRGNETCRRRCVDCRLLTQTNFAAAAHVDHVVSNSQAVMDIHRTHGMFRASAASVIHDVIRGPAPGEITKVDNGDILVFGFFGRIIPEKGLEILLEATSLLKNANWRVLIGGTGDADYLETLRRRFADPRISWLGFCKPEIYYPQIDVFVFPSIWIEPQGRTVIESYYYGCSAICAEIGGIAELATIGRQVEFYPPHDSRALAAIMDRAMGEPDRWRQGGFASTEAASIVSDEWVVGRHRAIFADLVTRRGA